MKRSALHNESHDATADRSSQSDGQQREPHLNTRPHPHTFLAGSVSTTEGSEPGSLHAEIKGDHLSMRKYISDDGRRLPRSWQEPVWQGERRETPAAATTAAAGSSQLIVER